MTKWSPKTLHMTQPLRCSGMSNICDDLMSRNGHTTLLSYWNWSHWIFWKGFGTALGLIMIYMCPHAFPATTLVMGLLSGGNHWGFRCVDGRSCKNGHDEFSRYDNRKLCMVHCVWLWMIMWQVQLYPITWNAGLRERLYHLNSSILYQFQKPHRLPH